MTQSSILIQTRVAPKFPQNSKSCCYDTRLHQQTVPFVKVQVGAERGGGWDVCFRPRTLSPRPVVFRIGLETVAQPGCHESQIAKKG